MRALRRVVVVVGVVLLGGVGGTAAAQTPPPAPGPTLPTDELAPVLELIGPASSPVCGGVGIVVFLSPPVLSQLGELGGLVLPALGPVLTLCGAIPATGDAERYTCALDEQSQATLADLLIPLAGIGPVVDVRPAGLPLDQVQVIVDALPPEFGLQQLLTQTSTILQCRQGNPEEPVPPSTATVVDPPSPAEPAPPVALPVAQVLAPRPAPVAAPPSPAAPAPAAAVPATPPAVAPSPTPTSRIVARVPFSYPGVFLVPFALLAGVAWFGRDLTRPLRDLAVERTPPPS